MSKNGGCITSEKAVQILTQTRQLKIQEDQAKKDRAALRLASKNNRAFEDQKRALEKTEKAERLRVLKEQQEVKRLNKKRKVCQECSKDMDSDGKERKKWMCCFDCCC